MYNKLTIQSGKFVCKERLLKRALVILDQSLRPHNLVRIYFLFMPKLHKVLQSVLPTKDVRGVIINLGQTA